MQHTLNIIYSDFYPVIYRRIKKKKTTNYSTLVFGHSLWSSISGQRKWLIFEFELTLYRETSRFLLDAHFLQSISEELDRGL